jgi:hypothetical protein
MKINTKKFGIRANALHIALILLVGIVIGIAAVLFFLRPGNGSDDPQPDPSPTPETQPQTSGTPSPPPDEEPDTTDQLPEPKPTAIELREIKPAGFRYEAQFSASFQGRGESDGWAKELGGASGYFNFTVHLAWTGEVLENDGRIVKERRTFQIAKSLSTISVEDFGLSPKLVAILLTADLATGGGFSLLVPHLERTVLPKIPILGPILGNQIEALIKQGEIFSTAELLNRLEGQTVEVVWEDGRFKEARVVGAPFQLSPQEERMVSRAATFVDFNVLPPAAGEIGYRWRVTPQQVFDYFAMEDEWRDAVRGQLVLERVEDIEAGRVAGVKLATPGKIEVNHGGRAAEIAINRFDGKVLYGSGGGGNVKMQFVTNVTTSGTGGADIPMRIFDYPFLRNISKLTGNLEFEGFYECTELP